MLSWLADERPELFERLRVVTGTSIGAVNAAFLASHGLTVGAVRELARIWSELRLDGVMRLTPSRVLRTIRGLGRPLFGARDVPAQGLFDAAPFERLIERAVDWDNLARVVRSGRLDGIAVAATEIASGRTHLFVDRRRGVALPQWPNDPSIRAIAGPIRAAHVLASTSLPLIFSPVKVGGHWYTDGGLRQNLPLSPALRLGADRLLAVSLGPDAPAHDPEPHVFPGLLQLFGKLLNSVFLDRVRWDLDRMRRVNTLLDAGEAIYGPDFGARMRVELSRRGVRPYQRVTYVGVRPEVDIGAIAARLIREDRLVSDLGFWFRKTLRTDAAEGADLSSYLLFDGAFARELIAEGRAAASHKATEIDALLA